MPKFSSYFKINLSQRELDFVDVSNEYDTPVYVDPYAIEIRDDFWSAQASEYIRTFFLSVLQSLREGNSIRAITLLSNLNEPKETFLGVSTGNPKGRGVGQGQAHQLMAGIRNSEAFRSGILSDLSEMALYVEGIDRDKISDLTTNIIRKLLVQYTQEQCELYGIKMQAYASPPMWDMDKKVWASEYINLPRVQDDPIILVPKYIVRRKLSLDSQEFYNKQITDFLISENLDANSSLVHVIKGERKVLKGDVRRKNPKSKAFIAEIVSKNPGILDIYKGIAKNDAAMQSFHDDDPDISSTCAALSSQFSTVSPGQADADKYHRLIIGSLTALFYPDLIHPHKEWEINDGRKRIDIVYTNASNSGFFSHRRDDKVVGANLVIVECKNYSSDIANAELDQLIGRFDDNRGRLGFITFRKAEDNDLLIKRCKDAAVRKQGFIILLSDEDIIRMLNAKGALKENIVEGIIYQKYRDLLS